MALLADRSTRRRLGSSDMTWLLAFLVSHAIEIAAVGGALAAVNQAEQVIISTTKIVKDAEKK